MASKHEEVMAGIASRLGGITAGAPAGSPAAYTPGRVARVAEFTKALSPLDSTVQIGGQPAPLFYIRPGLEKTKLGLSTCEIAADLEVFVLVALRFTEPTQQPAGGLSAMWGQLQAELAADLKQRIYADQTFGGILGTRLVDDSVFVDFDDRFIRGWVNVEARFVVRYLYNRPPLATDLR